MYTAILLVIVLSALGDISAEFSTRCEYFEPIDTFDEDQCASRIWYLYAGSIPCENCSMVRNITVLEPGILSITDALKTGNETTVYNYSGRKWKNCSVYFLNREEPTIAIIVETDCVNYITIYYPAESSFQIFTTKKRQKKIDLDSLSSVKQCNMELYVYSLGKSC